MYIGDGDMSAALEEASLRGVTASGLKLMLCGRGTLSAQYLWFFAGDALHDLLGELHHLGPGVRRPAYSSKRPYKTATRATRAILSSCAPAALPTVLLYSVLASNRGWVALQQDLTTLLTHCGHCW